MLKHLLCSLLSLGCHPSAQAVAHPPYTQYQEVQALIAQSSESGLYDPQRLQALFAQAQHLDSVLAAMKHPAESLTWATYGPLFLGDDRVAAGLAFWHAHAATLARAQSSYGVPAAVIVAILGIETRYGQRTGNYRVLDALSTLAFDEPQRARYFRQELLHFLQLCQAQHLDPLSVYGSYAGAMGYPQFMPSAWQDSAVDFDGDGHIDLIHDADDAIGSIAHYFQQHGWQAGPVADRAILTGQDYDAHLDTSLQTSSTVGALRQRGLRPQTAVADTTPASVLRLQGAQGMEFWLAYENFYVITRYNHSPLYAMAVWQLSEKLQAAMDADTATH